MGSSGLSSTGNTSSPSSCTPCMTILIVWMRHSVWILDDRSLRIVCEWSFYGVLNASLPAGLLLFDPSTETPNRSLELFPSITEILTQYNNVQKWSKPEKAPFSLNWTALHPVVKKEPKGTVLIINAFNYPIWLTFVPLVSILKKWETGMISISIR